MKSMITWHTLRQFAVICCCVLLIITLLNMLDADFDITALISPKTILFCFISSVLITLMMVTRRKKVGTNA